MQYRLTTREGVLNERHYLRRLFRGRDRISSYIGLWLAHGGSMTYDNNSYYEPEDDDYSYQNDVQERAAELIKSDKSYDYTDKVNFGEAIQQMSDADQETIRDYIAQKDWAKLGQKLACMSMTYQENLAQYIIENGK